MSARPRGPSLRSVAGLVLLVIHLSPSAVASPPSDVARIECDGFAVTVHETGVLVQGPPAGLHPSWGPWSKLDPHTAEWHGIAYRVDDRLHECVLGARADWAARTPATAVSFEASAGRAISHRRFGSLRIRTEYFFEEDDRHLIARTELVNEGDRTLHDLLVTFEWMAGADGGTFPPEFVGMLRPAPAQLQRGVWALGDLSAGMRKSFAMNYRHAVSPPVFDTVDVPLQLLITPNFPNGITTGLTRGVSFADDDQDGWPDLVIGQAVELYHNVNGQDWTLHIDLQTQLDPAISRYGISFGDYNEDGWPDFSTEPRESPTPIHLFKNLGTGINQYINVAQDPNIFDTVPSAPAETLCWGDVDGDGTLDYFLPVYPFWYYNGPGNFFCQNLGPAGPNGEYIFTEITQQVGLFNPPNTGKPEGAEMCDVDMDGDLDIYSNGTLYQNVSQLGAPQFRWMREHASGIQFSTDFDEGCVFIDYDMDGDQDLVIAYCSGGHGVRIYENYGDGMFFLTPKNIMDSADLGNCLGMSKADWDNDGDIDITSREVFRRNQMVETGVRKFTVATHNIPAGDLTSATPAWADWDKDGDLDAVIGNMTFVGRFYENALYDVNTPEEQRRQLRVKVVRDSPTVDRGLEIEYGANVEMFVAGEEYQTRRTQFVTSAGGYLNQNEYQVHFGLPPDPTPADPTSDVLFDLVVTFPSAPGALQRVDRHVNAELGNLDWADLTDREIVVYRSGRVIKNGHSYAPTLQASSTMSQTPPLELATDTVPLPAPAAAPGASWCVGMAFDTHSAPGPVLLKELTLDGALDGFVNCAAGRFRVFLWDVTTPGSPVLVDGFNTNPRTRNRRHHYRMNTVLAPGRDYRVVARVTALRESALPGPVLVDGVNIAGGLSFADPSPCSGANVEAAVVDATRATMSMRFVAHTDELWADLGNDVPGINGAALLTGSGRMSNNQSVSLQLSNGPIGQLTFLAIGQEAGFLGFAGGTLVPLPEWFLFPFTNASGDWTVSGTWPANVPPGWTSYYQVWFPDPGAVGGWAASNAVSGTTPF